MIRRSAILFSNAGRTIVRDPRKAKVPAVQSSSVPDVVTGRSGGPSELPLSLQDNKQMNLPFQPSPQNQEAIGSTLVSYMLAGAGMAFGFAIVGAIFGA